MNSHLFLFSKETMKAEMFLQNSSTQRAVFVSLSANDSSLSHVEQFVILHYKENGFPFGIHAEGSAVTTLFFLMFWDIVFMDVPDAFHGSFQVREILLLLWLSLMSSSHIHP